MAVKIVRTDGELECPELDQALRQLGELQLVSGDVSEGELIAATADADLLLMCYTKISAKVFEAAKRLKGVVKYGVGVDAIDFDAARRCRVPVVNVPEYAEETVAECAFGLMLALAKKLLPMSARMQSHGWFDPSTPWLGVDLAGKTLGIVGAGRIGNCMARMARGFRMRVLAYDPFVSAEAMRSSELEPRTHLLDLMSESDVVSIHCVLNEDTKGLIGEAELDAMKPTATLVNVSRGALVDEQALLRAVREQRIGGVGLDVYSREPLSVEGHPLSPLFGRPNVILLPHLAFYTQEAMQRLTQDTLDRCHEILRGDPVTIRSTDPRLRGQEYGVRVVSKAGQP